MAYVPPEEFLKIPRITPEGIFKIVSVEATENILGGFPIIVLGTICKFLKKIPILQGILTGTAKVSPKEFFNKFL